MRKRESWRSTDPPNTEGTLLKLVVTTALTLLASGCSGPERYSVVVRNVNLIDLDTGNSVVTNIGVRDGHIVSVGSSDIHGETTIDGTGLWAIPGLWDMHVHISGRSSP